MVHGRRSILVVALVGALVACQATGSTRVIQLTTLNDSGVTGTVTLVALDARRTRVEVVVDPNGHHDMPSHIHPGTCANLVPQPKHALQNVTDGRATTVVAASFEDLTAGGLAVNLHKSNEDMGTYTACADLGRATSAPGGSPSPASTPSRSVDSEDSY